MRLQRLSKIVFMILAFTVVGAFAQKPRLMQPKNDDTEIYANERRKVNESPIKIVGVRNALEVIGTKGSHYKILMPFADGYYNDDGDYNDVVGFVKKSELTALVLMQPKVDGTKIYADKTCNADGAPIATMDARDVFQIIGTEECCYRILTLTREPMVEGYVEKNQRMGLRAMQPKGDDTHIYYHEPPEPYEAPVAWVGTEDVLFIVETMERHYGVCGKFRQTLGGSSNGCGVVKKDKLTALSAENLYLVYHNFFVGVIICGHNNGKLIMPQYWEIIRDYRPKPSMRRPPPLPTTLE